MLYVSFFIGKQNSFWFWIFSNVFFYIGPISNCFIQYCLKVFKQDRKKLNFSWFLLLFWGKFEILNFFSFLTTIQVKFDTFSLIQSIIFEWLKTLILFISTRGKVQLESIFAIINAQLSTLGCSQKSQFWTGSKLSWDSSLLTNCCLCSVFV